MNLFFLIGYDLDRSPWATRPRAILNTLLEEGHQVTVVDLEEPAKTHAPIHPPIGDNPAVRHLRLKQRFLSSFDAPLAAWIARRRVRDCLKEADVVHIQKPKVLTWAVGRLAVSLGKAIVYDWDDLEGAGGIRSGWSGRKVDRIEAFFARHSRAIVVASRGLKEHVERNYPAHPQLHDGPCGVDSERFNPETIPSERVEQLRTQFGLLDNKVILYHGQMEMGDPGEALLTALRELRSERKVRLLLLGGGRIQTKMVQRAKTLRLEHALVAPGYLPFEDMPALLALADVAVVLPPDNAYGRCKSPLKLYEAMAMALPIVAAKVGQAADVLPDCGMLVPANDPKALAQALQTLLDDPARARRLGQAARRRAAGQHTWNRLGQTFREIYRSL